ncbi:4571_t:CDS:2 [Paraglomus brasilianum]|uniref:3-hydroxyacyl-CoA dehydrogenase n=1 Tax=Paraglomus brasilianum TaxID=144538 RepID=A0A9N9GP31_9GLOM|nr:4571_t:CDS:2 [Paraglomus brasilianum]
MNSLGRPSVLPLRSLSHSIRRFSTSPSSSIQKITIYGAGLMGAGITQVAAQNGLDVTMVDVSPDAIKKGKNIIDASLKRVASRLHKDDEKKRTEFIENVWKNISSSTDSSAAAVDADLLVEAIVENMKVKQELFSQLDKVAKKSAIFASNTSSLIISEIAKATNREENFAGLHFFNPVPQMKLVEVIRTDKTSNETCEKLMDVTKRMQKTPVTCKDTPGFIVNRLLVPYILEAFRLVGRGEATHADVDTAMKLGAGMPMGPFELADLVGLDTLKFIADGWRQSGKIDAHLVAPVKELDDLVANGDIGRKSGKGVYSYP